MYIDGFAGPGNFVSGSPLNALEVQPPFKEFHFIDADGDRTEQLLRLAGDRSDVFAYAGDCNEILPKEVLPRVTYEKYARALSILDPCNIDLSWEVVKRAGQMETVEMFLNLMIMDANMNILRRDPDSADPAQIARMNRFWGDDSWRQVAYSRTGNLFGYPEKTDNDDLAQAYRERLKRIAGFGHVPDPLPMRTKNGSTIYYFYFAAPKSKGGETGNRILIHIFDKYRKQMGG
jgi:three-Cys-motif partner protein